MRRRRIELGLTQRALADLVGIDARMVRRYEAGEQQPMLSSGVALAKALRISVPELAGVAARRLIDLSGEWWMSWQTTFRDTNVLTQQNVAFVQTDDLIALQTLSRGNVGIEEGGYNWRGELRIWDNRTLMGWYAATDGAVASKGTMYFILQTHGQSARGLWTGQSHDGDLCSGYGAIGRTADEAATAITELITQPGPPRIPVQPEEEEEGT